MERQSGNASGRGNDGEAQSGNASGRGSASGSDGEADGGSASASGSDGEADGAVQAAVAVMERQTGAVPATVARGRPVPQRPGRSPHRSQAGSEFTTPRSENNSNFRSNAQQKRSDSRWSEGCTAVLSEFSVFPTNPTHPLRGRPVPQRRPVTTPALRGRVRWIKAINSSMNSTILQCIKYEFECGVWRKFRTNLNQKVSCGDFFFSDVSYRHFGPRSAADGRLDQNSVSNPRENSSDSR